MARTNDLAPTLDELLAQADAPDQLDDDALGALVDDLREAIVGLIPEDRKTITDEVLAQAQETRTKLEALEAVGAERQEKATERAAAAEALLSDLTKTEASDEGGDGDEGDGETAEPAAEPVKEDDDTDEDAEPEKADEKKAEPTKVEVEVEDEKVEVEVEEVKVPEKIAASKPSVVTRVEPRRPNLRPRARASAAPQYALRASANVPGLTAGDDLTDKEKLALAFEGVVRAGAGYRGPRSAVPVASIGSFDPSELWGEERFLDDNARANEKKIDKITNQNVIRAAGGPCAPAVIDYTQPIIGTDTRPVRDALTRFAADRGGVMLIPPPKLSDVTGAVDIWTHDIDVTPGNDTKNVLTLTCPAGVTTYVDAITTAVKVGNFRNAYFRENVDAIVKMVATQAARIAEQKMLTAIGAGSTNVTVGTTLGTTRTVLAGLDRAAAGMRYRQRIDPDFPLTCILPAWLLDNIEADLAREAPGAPTERLAMADTYIEGFFRSRQINPVWALDGETSQRFGTQADGALNGWPSNAVGYLYVEGTWLHLDGGMLNVGVIRDSVLVGTNDFMMFSEFMENVAFHGTESLRIDFDICPDGTTSLPIAITPCTTNS